MRDNSIFNINSIVSNDDVVITINLDTNYEYTLYKNNEVYKTDNRSSVTDVLLDETGEYVIEVKTNDIVISSGIYKIDKEAPIIILDKENIKIKVGEHIDIYDGLKAYDEVDGNLIDKVSTNYEELDFKAPGSKKLEYTVVDSANNIATKQINITVLKDNNKQILFIDSIILLIFMIASILVIRYLKSIKLEKRISKYTIEPINDKPFSLFDKIYLKYEKIVLKFSKQVEKSVFLTKYSKRYKKYIGIVNNAFKKESEFVTSKIFIGFLFLIIAIFSKSLKSEVLSLYEIFIPISVGFFLPDLLYVSKYKLYRKKLENDILQAIIIMNNAFKSGRSITQAIDLVAHELKGPISEEFKKMSLELSFGLGIEEVFKRFSQRIQLEEVNYLTASLSVLNKTGGNIIKVFSSIEKTLFNQKKLKLELISLTSGSKIIVYILFAVPILFVAFISLVDPTYFVPLLSTPIGLIITFVILIVYIIYIIIIRKIMKVRM